MRGSSTTLSSLGATTIPIFSSFLTDSLSILSIYRFSRSSFLAFRFLSSRWSAVSPPPPTPPNTRAGDVEFASPTAKAAARRASSGDTGRLEGLAALGCAPVELPASDPDSTGTALAVASPFSVPPVAKISRSR